MSSPRHRIDVLLKKAKRLRRIDGSAVRDFIATTRELIEAHKIHADFPVTALYCNWSLHTQISASLTALRWLAEISKRQAAITPQSAGVQDYLKYLSEQAFQVDILRLELLKLAQQHDVSSFLFSSDENWNLFISLLLDGLIDKHLQYPLGADLPSGQSDSELMRKAKRIYQEASTSVGGARRRVFKEAWISLMVDPWDERPELERTPVFHCNIRAFEGPIFVVKITNAYPLAEADDYALAP